MQFRDVGNKWFVRRSAQATLQTIPRLPVYVKSGTIQTKKPLQQRTKGAPKAFIVGESIVGGEEVAL
jgi:hypothetical protein